jgi:hypothetical protein
LDTVSLNQGVRLLGVSLSGFGAPDLGVQLSLDLGPSVADPVDGPEGLGGTPTGADESGARLVEADEEAQRMQRSWGSVTAAVDAIRARYGGSSVGPASLVGADGLQVRRRGDAQWGPAAPGDLQANDESADTL